MTAFDISLFAWGRVIERLLVVGFSGLSMVLGWQLFIKGVAPDQTAEGKYKDWEIAFRKVGPGVFFVFFGAAVLSVALLKPLSINNQETTVKDDNALSPAVNNARPLSISYFTSDVRVKHTQVRALNTLLAIDPKNINFGDGIVVEADYSKAQAELAKLRYNILLTEFSSADLALWPKFGAAYSVDASKVPPEFRDVLGRMKPWFDETTVMEP